MNRPPLLQSFLDFAELSMCSQQRPADELRVVREVLAICRNRTARIHPARKSSLPVMAYLDDAFANARRGSSELVRLADTLDRLNGLLNWRSRTSTGPGASDNFSDGNASATIVGPGGYEDRDDVWIGATLLRPTVTYPDHSHPPEEAYLVLSPGAFRQKQGDWQPRGVDETFYNTPGILHSMRAEGAPMLALWFLTIR